MSEDSSLCFVFVLPYLQVRAFATSSSMHECRDGVPDGRTGSQADGVPGGRGPRRTGSHTDGQRRSYVDDVDEHLQYYTQRPDVRRETAGAVCVSLQFISASLIQPLISESHCCVYTLLLTNSLLSIKNNITMQCSTTRAPGCKREEPDPDRSHFYSESSSSEPDLWSEAFITGRRHTAAVTQTTDCRRSAHAKSYLLHTRRE